MLGASGCKNTVPPGAASSQSAVAMGDWYAWRDLSPLLDVASHHAAKPTSEALAEASRLLRKRQAKSADKRLATAANSSGRHWIAVARADLAALHFTLCIRGVAWRLEDGEAPSATDRSVDFSEETRIQPGDVSVEALLTNLDAALAANIPALSTQARIARARVTAFAQRCAANENVTEMARKTMESDLAILAAEGHLTPDLAYLWAGVQMSRFSGTAARPFLLQAREGGFDHPAVTFMLAVIALEERQLDEADDFAQRALSVYTELGDRPNMAEAWFVRGEVARAKTRAKAARRAYEAALKHGPMHIPALLALAAMTREDAGEPEAVDFVHGMLGRLVLDGELDQARAHEVASNLESLVIMATDPMMAQLSRDALVQGIEQEPDPMRRGLRYFYAATLDVRLREYELAHGHGVLAKEEFAQSEVPAPVDAQMFLRRLEGSR